MLVSTLMVGACAARAPSAPSRTADAPPAEVTVPRTVVTPERAASLPELYGEATKDFENARFERAALQFDRVSALEPEGELADDALYRAAEAHDQAGALDEAASRYERLAQRYPKSPLAATAAVRATRLLVHLERWDRASILAQRLLESGAQLNPFDQVLVFAASALQRIDKEDDRGAATFIERGREVIDAHRLDAAGRVGRELAALYYALGELRRIRAERIVFEPMPPDYLQALERRCQLILDAHSAYSDTMRAYDAHWSAMAGYRVGELYRGLHEDIMRVKPPASADTLEERQLFEATMRHRFSILLKKALTMVDLTLGMLERTKERSSFAPRLAQARTEINAAIEREDEAIKRLPFSKETLQSAIDAVAQRAEAQQSGKTQQKPAPAPSKSPSGASSSPR